MKTDNEHISRKHEFALIKLAQDGNDAKREKETKKSLRTIIKGLEARNELLVAHAGFIHSRAKYWFDKYPKIEYNEYYAEAVLGMCQAILKIDLKRNIRLTTYSWWVMNTEIRRFLGKNNLIRLKIDGDSPPLHVMSYDAVIGRGNVKLSDLIVDVKHLDPACMTDMSEDRMMLDKAAAELLNKKQRDVFYMKFHGATIEEIAKSHGVTKSSIGQTYNRALYKLTKYFEDVHKAG